MAAIRTLARNGLRRDLEDSLSARHGPEDDLELVWIHFGDVRVSRELDLSGVLSPSAPPGVY